MGSKNTWSDPSQTTLEDVKRMAAHLEDRANRSDQKQANYAVRDVLAPGPGERLLEVGSGTGLLCRLMAAHIAPGGFITGVDISSDFNLIARELNDKSDTAGWVQFTTGKAEQLPFLSNSFDGAWAARLMLHAAEPDATVDEMLRVIRPGGRVVLMDWDFETVAVDHPDRELTRRVLHWRTDHHGGDNWSGRKLLARLIAAGLKNPSVTPVTVIARDESAALTLSFWRAAEVARDAEAITSDEHDAWVSELKARIDGGAFFASMVYFVVKGWK